MRQSSATPSGSTGAGFTTTVLPQASAGPILPAQLVIGKLYGVMHATTPTGSRTAIPEARPLPCRPRNTCGGNASCTGARGQARRTSPDGCRRRRPAASRRRSAARRSRPWSDRRGSAFSRSNSSAALRSRAPRSAPLMRGHGPRSNASRAARAARCTCSTRALRREARRLLGRRIDDLVGARAPRAPRSPAMRTLS